MNPPSAPESQVSTERCPWCDSEISRSKFLQIKTKIANDERRKLAEERALIEARIMEEATRRVTAISAERDQVATKLKEMEVREAAVRQHAAAEAEARAKAEADEVLAGMTAERDRAAARLEEMEAREVAVRQQAVAEAEARARAEGEQALTAVAAEREEVASKLKELMDLAEQNQRALEHQRQALELDRDLKLLEKDAEHHREREQLLKKIDGLTRSLQHKTANDLGDGAEIDIYEALRDTFVGDDISRIKKGQPGADIRHRIVHKGIVCGAILIDSKNRQGWQHAYVTKLREDQVADNADHALLATSVFPAGKKELYIDQETSVVVVSRGRAIEMIRFLREAMVRMHCLGLSIEQRAEKREILYRYITSETYRQQLSEAIRVASDLLELDIEEKRAHDKVWEKRGRMTTRLRNVVRNVDTEIGAIIEGRAGTLND